MRRLVGKISPLVLSLAVTTARLSFGALVAPRRLRLRHAIDWEGASQADPGVAVAAVQRHTATCPGHPALVYCSQAKMPTIIAALTHAGLANERDYVLWVADWGGVPGEDWSFWQDSDGGGRLDTDVFAGDRAACDAFFASTPPPPPPGGDDLTPEESRKLQALYTNLFGKMLFIKGSPRPDPAKSPEEAAGWDEAAATAKLLLGQPAAPAKAPAAPKARAKAPAKA
jgi:hypothetical protein